MNKVFLLYIKKNNQNIKIFIYYFLFLICKKYLRTLSNLPSFAFFSIFIRIFIKIRMFFFVKLINKLIYLVFGIIISKIISIKEDFTINLFNFFLKKKFIIFSK